MKRLYLVFLAIFSLPLVFAGTLISGNQLDIESNVDGITGLTLQGVYSTTPYASDEVFITRDDVPTSHNGENLEQTRRIRIDFSDPDYAETFRTGTQTRLYKVQLREEDTGFYGWRSEDNLEYCADQLRSRAEAEGYTVVSPVLAEIQGIGYLDCDGIMIVEQETEGYVAPLNNEQIQFSQTVTVDGDTMSIYNDERGRKLSDRISNDARIQLLSFDDLLSARLDSNRVYGFDDKRTNQDWNVFETTGGIQRYQGYKSTLTSDSPYDLNLFLGESIITENRDEMLGVIRTHNNNVDTVLSERFDDPQQWRGRADLDNVQTRSNLVTVPYSTGSSSLSHEVQVQLRGEKWEINGRKNE